MQQKFGPSIPHSIELPDRNQQRCAFGALEVSLWLAENIADELPFVVQGMISFFHQSTARVIFTYFQKLQMTPQLQKKEKKCQR